MSRWMPIAASAQAGDIDRVMTLVHGLMAVLFIGWFAYFAWALMRFRQARQPIANYHGANGRVATRTEIGVVIGEERPVDRVRAAAVVCACGSAGGRRTCATVVRVVAARGATRGTRALPSARTAALVRRRRLSSRRSIRSGWNRASPFGQDDIVMVNEFARAGRTPGRRPALEQGRHPQFRIAELPAWKQDVIPGMISTAWFTPTVEGRFDIACSQLCGLGHYRHAPGTVIVESDAAFQQFLADEAACGSESR